MSFTSVGFLFIFFPMSVLAYYIARKIHVKLSELVLLMFSLVFYRWAGIVDFKFLLIYIVLIYLLGRVAFICSKYGKEESSIKIYQKQVMGGMLLLIIGILFQYKYYNFVIGIIDQLTKIKMAENALLIPLGLSYLIFSGISYVVDIYRGDELPGTLLGTANYIAFFPKIACGPIALYKDFNQLKNKAGFQLDQFTEGINRIIIGMAKKLIFADYFGMVLSTIPTVGIDAATGVLTIVIYSLQLVFDFAGYSDMAIGFGLLFGYNLPENFHFPYLSLSITEFWRRWHMSLGRFFKEYLYIPLGGNRKGKIRTLLNLMIVFIATGIWHGAGWNYLIWGSMHGVCEVGERACKGQKWVTKIPKIVRWLFTITVVFIGWQFFRFTSLEDFASLFKIIFNQQGKVVFSWNYYLTIKLCILSIIGMFGMSFLGIDWFQRRIQKLQDYPIAMVIKQGLLLILFALSVFSMVSSTYSPFLYFRY